MRKLACALLLFAVLPFGAAAQEDVILAPTEGVFTLAATWGPEPDLAHVCFVRMDTDVLLGCAEQVEEWGAGIPAGVLRDIRIENPGYDVEVRAYAEDQSGNRSVWSPNKAILDFTVPAPPVMLPEP